jgi:hypothetical protein
MKSPRQTRCLFLALAVAALSTGCGARSSLGEVVAACDGVPCDTPRVADCKRLTPEAVPLARLAPSSPGAGDVSGFYFAADDEHLYFYSEGRIWRVSKKAGAPVALSPTDSGGGELHLTGDTLVWAKGGEIRRMVKTGGTPTTVVTFPSHPLLTVIGSDILSVEPQQKPAPIVITSLVDGTSSELLPSTPDTFVHEIGADGESALVQRSQDLLTVPLNGDPPAVLTTFSATGAAPPLADATSIYFGARPPDSLHPALYRALKQPGSTPEVLLDGFPVSTALDGATLYAKIALRNPDGTYTGALVHVPASGGDLVKMAATDAKGNGSTFQESTSGLIVGDEYVYFIESCDPSDDGSAYRLVSLPKDHVASP